MISQRVRKLLDEIDDILVDGGYIAQPNSDAADLWHVLTGLRGPDSGDEVLKKLTTAPIRQATFPKCARLARLALNTYGYAHGAYYGDEETKFSLPFSNDHFGQHAIVAAQALGIISEK